LNYDQELGRYREARRRYYERMDKLRAQIDSWVETHAVQPPPVGAVARLEALHAERARLLNDFQLLEDNFVTQLLERQSQQSSPSQ
jgi:hypothetical protein